MSFLGSLIKLPSVHLVDGVVREKTIRDITGAISNAFLITENIIGDIFGNSESPYKTSRYVNSIGSAIGSQQYISPEEPFGVEFLGYTQTFAGNSDYKEIVLDLNPVETSLQIFSPIDTGLSWSRVANASLLSEDGHYAIDGRVVVFYKVPSGSYTVTYNGTYPQFNNMTGFMPNVVPNPTHIEENKIRKPSVSLLGNGRYRLSILDSIYENHNQKEFGASLTIKLNEVLESFVSVGGSIPCPQDLVSIWIKNKTTNTFRRVECQNVYIIANNIFEFETNEQISNVNDIVVVSLSNISISDMIRNLYLSLATHDHNREGSISPIKHSNLIGVIPVSDNQDIKYSGSNISGNDHPQYIHREGYKDGDIGTYNNIMLGDLVLGSINKAGLFLNSDFDSNKLVFGSPTTGISLKFTKDLDSLLLYSSKNGLAISSQTSIGSDGFALSLDGHKFKNTIVDEIDILDITPSTGIVRIVAPAGNELGELQAKDITANKTSTVELEIKENGSITIGDVVFEEENGNVVVSGDGTITINPETRLNSFLGNYLIDANSSISFGNNDTKLYLHNNKATFTSPYSFDLNATGRGTGLSISQNITEFLNIYASDSKGEDTQADALIVAELGEAGLFLLRSTDGTITSNGQDYTWGPSSRIDSWPRAPLTAGHSTLTSIVVDTSSLTEKRGIKFAKGGLEFGSIYVTGGDTECPAGYMVVESGSGVIFVDSGAGAVDCQTMKYAPITSGDVQSFGSIIADQEISSGGDIRTASSLTGKNLEILDAADIGGDLDVEGALTVGSESKFTSNVLFNSNIETRGHSVVQGKSTLGTLEVTGQSSFEGSSQFKSDLIVARNARIQGSLTVVGAVKFESKMDVDNANIDELTISRSLESFGPMVARSGLDVEGQFSVDGFGSVSQGLTIGGQLIASDAMATLGKVFIEDTLDIASNLTVKGDATVTGSMAIGKSATDKLTVLADANFSGDNFLVAGEMSCLGKTTIAGELSVNASAEISSTLTVKGITTIESALHVESGLTSKSIRADDIAIDNNLSVGGLSVFDGNAYIKGSLNVGGDFSMIGSFRANGGLIAGADSISSIGDLEVSGGLTQSDPHASSSFAGPLITASDFSAFGTVRFQNDVIIGSQESNNSILIAGNKIEASGNTSLISSASIATGAIIGIGDVHIPHVVTDFASSKSIDFFSENNKWIKFGSSYFERFAVFADAVFIPGTLFVRKIENYVTDDSNIEYVDLIAKEAYYAP